MRIGLVQEIKVGKWNSMLGQEDITAIIALSLEQLSEKIAGFSLVPMRIESRLDMALFRIYFTSCWLEVYDKVSLNPLPRVLEIAPGQFDPIPQSLEIASSGSGEYFTANLNRQLSARLRENTKALNITVKVIEDNALNLRNHLREQYFDLIGFQHAINDIIQGIIADKNGVDTTGTDWFEILPRLIEGVVKYSSQDKLEEAAYREFIDIIEVAYSLLKPSGYMIFNNHIFKLDLDYGAPLDLYSSFIQIAKDWITTAGLKLSLVEFPGFDPKWWLFLQKD